MQPARRRPAARTGRHASARGAPIIPELGLSTAGSRDSKARTAASATPGRLPRRPPPRYPPDVSATPPAHPSGESACRQPAKPDQAENLAAGTSHVSVVRPSAFDPGEVPGIQEVAMPTPSRTRLRHLARLAAAAALAAGCLIAAVAEQRARAQDSGAQAGRPLRRRPRPAATGAPGSARLRAPAGNLTPVTLQAHAALGRAVPATDGLIHLPYTAQATNTQAVPAEILSVVAGGPAGRFRPDRAQPHHRRAGARPCRQSAAVRRLAGQQPCRTTRSWRGNPCRASPRACRAATRG